ncbi:radical SAM protein [Sphingopyxis sp. BSNA05]|uniref:PA0069 family radical SAM protein n=1 Tax=Sphingomonadales TaxID=204457 RepID=UPI000C1E51AA|nr:MULTISPECIES: PA0069 family radical SAM protein [Sphingomonadaceae]ATW04975.1 radical SAM protein [Sphingorhabdus sp. YGSMI21]NRD90562.1 radical SAM protein [Sphingopyxis sp. BSNA05]
MVDKSRILHQVQKGRGAPSNGVSQRFNLLDRETDGDWLDERERIGDSAARLRTDVTVEFPKSIISYNSSPDLPFDRSINAYRGCEHGCVYCYARPTHAYHDLSPGLDFESKLFAKPNAAELLRQTFAKPAYRPASLAIGTNTDPYQPIEKRYRITRQILEVMLETHHPVVITTKSNRVVEDIDLLTRLAAKQLTAVAISITSLDPQTARLLEPRAPAPARRLEAVRALSAAGIYAHVNIAPVVPGITDHEIEAIVAAAADCGARSISFIPMRLPHEVAPLFEQWLESHYPERKAKVMSIVRQIRGGKRNDPDFHSRMRGQGPWADLIRTRIGIASRKAGIGKAKLKLRTDLFRRPVIKGSQMELF